MICQTSEPCVSNKVQQLIFKLLVMNRIYKNIFTVIFCSCLLATSNNAQAAQNSVVALMYHHFGDTRYPSTNIRLEQFEQHLQFIEQNNFKVIALQVALEAITNSTPLPDKSIVITVDDAYLSVYKEAYPRLKQRGWPFTVFVSTDYIDKKFSNYMSWQQMQEMEQNGARFGNHSRSHDYLIRQFDDETREQWQQRIHDDISYAQKRLQDKLERPVMAIAYPYGEYNIDIANIVQKIGLTGLGQHSGAIGSTSDFRFLPRFPMNENFGEIEGFKSKINSLAMPLLETPQIDPQITTTRPILKVQLKQALTQLVCYASGQGKIEVNWLDEKTFSVQANTDLPAGRSRYNCTAPSSEPGRYYWFSQLWIRPNGTENEY